MRNEKVGDVQKLIIAALLGASLATTAVPASAGTAHRVDAAAGWLARQMADGERLETEFGGVKYPDQGLTIDAIFAFAAARTADDYADRAIAWLAKPETSSAYLGSDGESYAGAHAKLAVAARVKGKNPRAFGDVDLVAGLKALQAPSGRFSDRSQFGDFSNAFTQSYALFALGRDAQGASYLAASQCPDGGFPVTFETSPCVSDVDATAIVVQALRTQGKPTVSALTWLRSKQQADGGFPAALGGSNANSTGLAAQVVNGIAAVRARDYLKSLQVGCAGVEKGAIAFDASGFDKATATRATAQAVLGLTGANLVTLRSGGPDGAPTLHC
ncbi:prenyltransferase/squalene oxidase-like repeat protein [Lentzea flaviverrucosa]|uniref:Prenyltransferase and squalene oxidase repeat-containing protein n=1 Tax=Lentzea flaviverrucosa TaxID=200379 RepID=A0A1H9VLJ7_9PSEU|nr:prenyltransferase/squalene oxidase-like repeat protein [Lentzea flaviverrucosa]SES22073.1 Prenyltransferase and squalene oxidase repeat-containing protein [Lentzea flaviverrucosa]